jgi:hypothetical protein
VLFRPVKRLGTNRLIMGEISGVSTANIDNVDGFYTTQSGGGGGTATTTPTISLSGGVFGNVSVEVTNHSGYTNPNYECIVTAGATTTVADADVNHTLDSGADSLSANLSFADTNAATGTRTVSVKAQEFGDYVQSSAATATFDISYVQDHYVRLQSVTSTGSPTTLRTAIDDIRFCTGAGGTGTAYPTTNLTSNTSETGIVVSQGHLYSSSYDAYKACDSNTTGTMAWLLGTSAANNWWQIQWETGTYATAPEIKSIKVRFDGNQQTLYFKLMGSSTGAFSGEETDYGVFYISARNSTIYYG